MSEPAEVEDDPPERARSPWRYSIEGLRLVWDTSPRLTILLVIATIVSGLAPAGAAYVSRFVVDAVVEATRGVESARETALWSIGLEGVLVTLFLAGQRATTFAQALLKAKLAHHVNLKILRKAVTLPLAAFEDPSLQDRMEEARREATVRPLDLVMRVMVIARFAIGLLGFAALLVDLSWWTLVIVLLAGVPSFVAEARFSKEAFRFFQRHSPENRERHYLETLVTREDFAKEVGFFGLGAILVGRYDALFSSLYGEDRRIAIKRHTWGLLLGLLGNAAFFLAYVWIVHKATGGKVTIGQMTMFLVVFRQAQQAVTSLLSALGGVYEDALYLENLDAFLAHPSTSREGSRKSIGDPQDGLRVDGVCFTYEGAERPALEDVSFHLRPGRTLAIVGHNGSGKSTLVKLLTRRYEPSAGRILLDGLELSEWTDEALRKRISVLFQDYVRFKLTAGENIGAGDPTHIEDEARWRRAAKEALAEGVVEALPEGYRTRLGKAYRGGVELSGGEWQRIALARALMREGTELVIFDEPTSAADPKHQAELDERLEELLKGRMGVIVSHRLASARIADEILVLDHGRVLERGSHQELVDKRGVYAELFEAQASSYR